ncbi:helix-loop-helix DNA-binding domain-containing protein [Xylariaceae sp. FL0662B]|nr:helix-loop-helix DNA-binding domain-containing protein [Xylariaceae sp. FL0662B]
MPTIQQSLNPDTAMMDPGAWNGRDQTVSSNGEDEFHFIDMGGMSNMEDALHFDFQGFNATNPASMMHQAHHDTMDTPMTNSNISPIPSTADMGVRNQISSMTTAPNHPTIPSQMMSPHNTSNDAVSISEIDAQIEFLQHQRLQQQQRQLEEHQQRFQFFAQQHGSIVPPTPQSIDMQAATQFFAQHNQAHSSGMFDGYQPLKDQQEMAFTPLVSPAVTPLDSHFSADSQFTVPGAYFTPLTSPALHAQNDSVSMFDQRHSGQTTNSPAEMDIELPPASASTSNLSRKVRKSNAAKTRKSNIRQSPISKPQKKKTASTPVMNAEALGELAESAAEGSEPPPKRMSLSVTSTEGSENASVSPEASSEMPPPPLPPPRSARQSPYIQPRADSSTMPLPLPASLQGKPSPATPASLLKFSPKSKLDDPNNPEQIGSEHIDSLELPEPISFSKPDLPPLNTQQPAPSSEVETAKTATFQTLPSPVLPEPSCSTAASVPASASQSPQITPKSTTPNPRKTPLIGPRGGKKRTSVSSVSPALRPRISPNIKPLLPGTPGMSAEDTASRLLASKSNYQNILEGNKVPGVSYPSELSTNLTSKRTSHKIAEQGRRNRINTALQEIATLLPKNVVKELSDGDGDSGEKKDGKQSNAQASKARTVESAIEYIKQLQQQVATANQRAEAAEKRLGEKAAS